MTSRAQVLRKHMTEAERALWQHLRNKQITHDANRTAWLQSQGFVVLRFWNNEVLTDPEGVVAKIAQVLPPT